MDPVLRVRYVDCCPRCRRRNPVIPCRLRSAEHGHGVVATYQCDQQHTWNAGWAWWDGVPHPTDDTPTPKENELTELTFREVSNTNRARAERWHPGFPNDGWTGADWSNAMAGEAGEACNVVKKLRRHEFNLQQATTPPPAELLQQLKEEIGGTFMYLDLLAQHYGLSLADIVVYEFNRVSEREGFPQRLPAGNADGTMIGPLTAEEWCSLRLGTDDDPFQCCGDTSDLRDAAFHALRMGGGEEHGIEFHAAWLRVTESHPGTALAEHPVVAKLYKSYVEGKEPPPTDEELDAWIGDQRMKTQRGATREIFTRAGEGFSAPSPEDLDWLLDEHLAEIADKAKGSFRRENEALFTGGATPNVQYATLNHLLTVVSALRLVLGYKPTPIGTEIVEQLHAEKTTQDVA